MGLVQFARDNRGRHLDRRDLVRNILLTRVARYLAAHPQVEIDNSLDERYVDLRNDPIDLAIRIGRLPDSQLIARQPVAGRKVLCAAPSFITREGVPTTPEDLLTRLGWPSAKRSPQEKKARGFIDYPAGVSGDEPEWDNFGEKR